jgi:hypothetical protein
MIICFEDSHTLTSAYTNACVRHVHFWRRVRIPPGSFSHFGFPETTRCNLHVVACRKICEDRERRERKGDRGSDRKLLVQTRRGKQKNTVTLALLSRHTERFTSK